MKSLQALQLIRHICNAQLLPPEERTELSEQCRLRQTDAMKESRFQGIIRDIRNELEAQHINEN